MSEDVKKEAIESGVVDSQVSQDDKKGQAVPMHRFNEVISERNDLRDRVLKIESDNKQARANKLEEQGKFETLLTEERERGKSLSSKLGETETTLNSYVTDEKNRLLSKLPEEKRERYENVDVLTLRNLVDDFSQSEIQNVKKAESGTGRKTLPENPFKSMDKTEKRKNWQDILDSYSKN